MVELEICEASRSLIFLFYHFYSILILTENLIVKFQFPFSIDITGSYLLLLKVFKEFFDTITFSIVPLLRSIFLISLFEFSFPRTN